MASRLDELTCEQLKQVDDIVNIGNELGLKNTLIETAILVANAESDFDPKARAGTSTAYGLFQHIEGTWRNLHGNGTLNGRDNQDKRIEAFYKDLKEYSGWYSNPATICPALFKAPTTESLT